MAQASPFHSNADAAGRRRRALVPSVAAGCFASRAQARRRSTLSFLQPHGHAGCRRSAFQYISFEHGYAFHHFHTLYEPVQRAYPLRHPRAHISYTFHQPTLNFPFGFAFVCGQTQVKEPTRYSYLIHFNYIKGHDLYCGHRGEHLPPGRGRGGVSPNRSRPVWLYIHL